MAETESVGYAWDVSDGQRCLVVAVHGSFVATWLERRVFGDITRALEAVAGEGTTVRFEAGELVIGGPGDEMAERNDPGDGIVVQLGEVHVKTAEEDWRSSHPLTPEDLQEDLIGTLDTYLSRPSNEDLLQKLYDLYFVRIDKEAEPGLDAVHEASRDLVAVGYDPAHVAPVAAVIFANLLEVLLAKWWRDLGEEGTGGHATPDR